MRPITCVLLTLYAMTCQAQDLPHHQLQALLNPAGHALECVDQISVPSGSPRTLSFIMKSGLQPRSPDARLVAHRHSESAGMTRYSVTLPEGKSRFTVAWTGTVFEPPRQDARETRVFETSSGIIATEGVVLNGSSGWYPILENAPGEGMITFTLDVTVPAHWEAVSQGKMTGRTVPVSADVVRIEWEETHPQEEIHLIAAPFRVYRQLIDGVEELVYLRGTDDALAARYLDATSRYLATYRKLIGEYPYAKFALVENFWETGYGMPSFTLLGSQVMRLPFIINTSYPHEILHNWWGNGVLVDYRSGNWSEGLTAYLADHLLQEEKGSAADYRRGALQKYTDYVSAGRDFPLNEFVSRHSASSEAVGYGKALMMFHMLRGKIGDEKFKTALQRFYAEFKFKRAGFKNLERTFSAVAGQDLAPFFSQWVLRPGAPELRLINADAQAHGDGYELNIGIEQVQQAAPFVLDLPLAVTLDGDDQAHSIKVPMSGRKGEWKLRFAKKPLRVDVDPEFDLFRRLDPGEVPPAFSQVFGAEKLLLVLPHEASPDLQTQYQAIAQKWQQQVGRGAEVAWDDEISEIPKSGSVWLFGWENRWREQLKAALTELGARMSQQELTLGDSVYSQSGNSMAVTAHIGNTPVGWLAVPEAEMMPMLARKLPHYAKYSYAIFAGGQLQNQAKGMWSQTRSALQIAVRDGEGLLTESARGKLQARHSLISE